MIALIQPAGRRAATLALLSLLFCGCSNGGSPANPPKASGKLVAAQLDTLPLLQQNPEYQRLSQGYIRENLELRKKIQGQVDKGLMPKEQAMPTYLREQKALNDRWIKQTNDFIQGSHGQLREAVKQLCEEKDIDIVLIHSRVYPTIAWGALDITQDVGMKIYGSAIQGTPTPGGTPE